MDVEFKLEDPASPELTASYRWWGGVRLRADGAELPRRGARQRFLVPMRDGSQRDLLFRERFPDFALVGYTSAGRQKVGPGLAWWKVTLVFLPLALVFGGGLLGGVVGATGAYVNSRLFRADAPAPLLVAGALGVLALSGVAYFALAVAVTQLVR